MRIAQDEMILAVVLVQETLYNLLKSGQRAKETRKQVDACDDETQKVEVEMAGARPVHHQFIKLQNAHLLSHPQQ